MLTRRGFVGRVAGSLTAVLPVDLSLPLCLPLPSRIATRPGRVLLDLGQQCGLRESLSGYQLALAETPSLPRSALLIVPAAVGLPPSAVRTIVSCLRAGGTVLLESGAGFAPARDYQLHRAMLRQYFGIHVGAAVTLWSPPLPNGIPYVDYTWPCRARIRDFSRVAPLEEQGEIIARVDGLPVSLRCRARPGTLIFLGSPLGPALWAGDADAKRWFCHLVAR